MRDLAQWQNRYDRNMRALTVLVVAVCCGGAGWHDDEDHRPGTFTEVVQLIVRSSRENLRPLKTSRIEMHPSMHYWYEVSDELPGASMCRIYEHPKMVYRCEWPGGKDMDGAYARLAARIGEALGTDGWNVVRETTVTRFVPVNPHRNGLIEVQLNRSGRGRKLEVMFYAITRQ